MKKKEIDNLLSEGSDQLKKLHEIVHETMEEQNLLVRKLGEGQEESATFGQRISDKVAKFGGSWKFIILFSVILTIWILLNVLLIAQNRFDPYPFILMNLVLSCIAAFQAPIIMMSQNRQEEKDRKRAENDYMINLKSEIEIRALQEKMDVLIEEQIKTLFEVQKKQFDLMMEISHKLDKTIGTKPEAK